MMGCAYAASVAASLAAGGTAWVFTTDAALAGMAAAGAAAALLPLFSRIRDAELLVQDVRGRIHRLVREQPGINLRDLAEQASIGWGTVVYHVNRLEAAGLLTSHTKGRQRHLFARGQRAQVPESSRAGPVPNAPRSAIGTRETHNP